MSFDSGIYMAEEGLAEMITAILSFLSTNVLSGVLSIAAYILSSLGLYTIAQRRGIRSPWMAWVPVLNMWILGSIADQYRYVARGEIRNRRKVLVVLTALQTVAWIVMIALLIGMVVSVFAQIPRLEMMTDQQALDFVLRNLLPMLAVLLVMGVIALVASVFYYIAYYDLFASCEPDNKVLYLVLSILFSVTLPFFVFACRKKDLGMPPRRTQQTEPAQYQAMQAPEEPWNNPEE